MCQQGALIQWTFGSCFRQTRGRILFLELCSGFLALNSHLNSISLSQGEIRDKAAVGLLNRPD